jgi:disulfide bond formation protein DsbB
MKLIIAQFEKLIPNAFLVIFLMSVAVLGGAYIFQYGFGYAPCELCYYQRYPYMGTIIASAIGILAQKGLINLDRSLIIYLLLLCAVLFVVNSGIAAYHSGVEYKWWQGPTACTSTVSFSGSAADRLQQLLSAPVIRCDEAPWSLFGISMAGYNFLIASFMAFFAIVSLSRLKKNKV